MEQELEKLNDEAVAALESISNHDQLEAFRIKYLGSNGQTQLGIMKQLGSVGQRRADLALDNWPIRLKQ